MKSQFFFRCRLGGSHSPPGSWRSQGQALEGNLRDRLLGAFDGVFRGSWDRLLGAFDGVFRDRSASVAVISSECPEVTQKDHVRPEKLRQPAIESRFQV